MDIIHKCRSALRSPCALGCTVIRLVVQWTAGGLGNWVWWKRCRVPSSISVQSRRARCGQGDSLLRQLSGEFGVLVAKCVYVYMHNARPLVLNWFVLVCTLACTGMYTQSMLRPNVGPRHDGSVAPGHLSGVFSCIFGMPIVAKGVRPGRAQPDSALAFPDFRWAVCLPNYVCRDVVDDLTGAANLRWGGLSYQAWGWALCGMRASRLRGVVVALCLMGL